LIPEKRVALPTSERLDDNRVVNDLECVLTMRAIDGRGRATSDARRSKDRSIADVDADVEGGRDNNNNKGSNNKEELAT
jgi:hypothetical protein